MTIGKNPHRPEGKANTDNEHMQATWMSKGAPYDTGPSEKQKATRDRRLMEEGGVPSEAVEHEQIGGSRPGVESRVKEAIAEREAREESEEE